MLGGLTNVAHTLQSGKGYKGSRLRSYPYNMPQQPQLYAPFPQISAQGDRHLSRKQPIHIRITVSRKLSSRHRHLLVGFHRQVRTLRDLFRGRATSAACTATKQWTAAKSNAKIISFLQREMTCAE